MSAAGGMPGGRYLSPDERSPMAKVKIEDTMGVFLEASSLSPEEPVKGEQGVEEAAPEAIEEEEAVETAPDIPEVEEDPEPEPAPEPEKKAPGRRRVVKPAPEPAPEPEPEPEPNLGAEEPDQDLEDGSIEEVVQFIEKFALLKSNQLPLFSSVLSTGVMAMEAATREELSALENQQKALQKDLETVKRRRDALAEVKKIIERKN